MRNILRRKTAADPAAKRYPEALAALLSLGKPTDDTNYQKWAERLKDHAPDLIRMVLDEDLNQRMEDDRIAYTPCPMCFVRLTAPRPPHLTIKWSSPRV